MASTDVLLSHMSTILYVLTLLAACTAIGCYVMIMDREFFPLMATVGIGLIIIALYILITLVNFISAPTGPSTSNVGTNKACPDYFAPVEGGACSSKIKLSGEEGEVTYTLLANVDAASDVPSMIQLQAMTNVSDASICDFANNNNVPWTAVAPLICDKYSG